MKHHRVLFLAISMLTVLFYSDNALAGRIKNRQTMQQGRISEGIESGELNQNEIQNLEQEQKQIQKFKRNARSDGQLTVKERIQIENMQDRANKHINRAKHNQIKDQNQD